MTGEPPPDRSEEEREAARLARERARAERAERAERGGGARRGEPATARARALFRKPRAEPDGEGERSPLPEPEGAELELPRRPL
ncbi:MAG TPA: hypothetical protein VF517_08650, partial [Thermoleophilaceae bacterium]